MQEQVRTDGLQKEVVITVGKVQEIRVEKLLEVAVMTKGNCMGLEDKGECA